MMSRVKDADVIVTNRTHDAVALEYKPNKMSAPRLAAKGAGILAQKIKEETRFDDIPTVENVPGSCAVSQCRSGAEIPIELYRPSPKF